MRKEFIHRNKIDTFTISTEDDKCTIEVYEHDGIRGEELASITIPKSVILNIVEEMKRESK